MTWHPQEGDVADVRLNQSANGDWVIVWPSTFGTVRIVEDADLLPANRMEEYAKIEILEPKFNRFISRRARVLDVDVTLQNVDGYVGVRGEATNPDIGRIADIRQKFAQSDL